jgi:hypothetical protein
MMMSLWPSGSYPMPKMMIGVTEMMVIMTMEAKISRVIVARERQLMRAFDSMSIAQLFLSFCII